MDVEPGNRVMKDQLLEPEGSLRGQHAARRRPSRRLIRRPHCLRGAGRSVEHLTSLGQSKDFTVLFGKQWIQERLKNPAFWAGTSGNIGDPLLEDSPEDVEGGKLPEEKLISGRPPRRITMDNITMRSSRR